MIGSQVEEKDQLIFLHVIGSQAEEKDQLISTHLIGSQAEEKGQILSQWAKIVLQKLLKSISMMYNHALWLMLL